MNLFKVSLLTLSLSVTGCATSKQYYYRNALTSHTPSFTVIDQRPVLEKKAAKTGSLVSSDKLAVHRLGDEQLHPDRITYLSELLASKANEQLAGKTLTIERFEILNNQAKFTRHNAGGSMFGMAGVLLVAAANGNRDNAQFEIDLTLTLDAQRYRSMLTYPYYIDPMKHITDAELATHLRQAIEQSAADILTQLPTAAEQPPQLTLGD